MDSDQFVPAFKRQNALKTYSKLDKSVNKSMNSNSNMAESEREPLTTKNAVTFLMNGTLKSKVCRYCLNVTSDLMELDLIMNVAHKDAIYNVTVRDMVATFHPFKVSEAPDLPNKICNKCLNRTISAYLFAQQCERSERALKNCFEDMFDKVEKLDPLERPKKRGRYKANPNVNILKAEFETVMEYADPIIHLVHQSSEPLTPQTPISENECLKCCQVLPNLESLLNHTKTHPSTMWYNCRLCGKSYPKLTQLKKHLRSDHSDQKPEFDQKYDCSKCGAAFSNYYEYLPHIDKHKFKVVMDHLLTKNMDKLCAVCLSKSRDMSTLNKSISLNGGGPALSGDIPLHSILASMIPEKKNKYQELIMPAQANIVKYVRKGRNRKAEFVLSKPIVISMYTPEWADHDFTFSSPIEAEKEKKTDDVVMKEHAPEKSEVMVIDDKPPPIVEPPTRVLKRKAEPIIEDAEIQTDSSIKFSFSKPKYDINEKTVIVKKIIEKEIKEKVDLAYSKLVGEKTAPVPPKINPSSKLEPIVPMPTDSTDNGKCKFCWVFLHLDKCEHCKDPIKKHFTFKLDITPAVKENAEKKEEVKIQEKVTEPVKTTEPDIFAMKSKPDQTKWRCDVCLVENPKDKENCVCCGSRSTKIEGGSFKFGQLKTTPQSKPSLAPPSLGLGLGLPSAPAGIITSSGFQFKDPSKSKDEPPKPAIQNPPVIQFGVKTTKSEEVAIPTPIKNIVSTISFKSFTSTVSTTASTAITPALVTTASTTVAATSATAATVATAATAASISTAIPSTTAIAPLSTTPTATVSTTPAVTTVTSLGKNLITTPTYTPAKDPNQPKLMSPFIEESMDIEDIEVSGNIAAAKHNFSVPVGTTLTVNPTQEKFTLPVASTLTPTTAAQEKFTFNLPSSMSKDKFTLPTNTFALPTNSTPEKFTMPVANTFNLPTNLTPQDKFTMPTPGSFTLATNLPSQDKFSMPAANPLTANTFSQQNFSMPGTPSNVPTNVVFSMGTGEKTQQPRRFLKASRRSGRTSHN